MNEQIENDYIKCLQDEIKFLRERSKILDQENAKLKERVACLEINLGQIVTNGENIELPYNQLTMDEEHA